MTSKAAKQRRNVAKQPKCWGCNNQLNRAVQATGAKRCEPCTAQLTHVMLADSEDVHIYVGQPPR